MVLLLAGTAGAGDAAAGTGTDATYRRLREIDERMQHEADHPASMGEADEMGGRPHGGAETDAGDLGSDDEDGDSHEITSPAPPSPAAPGIGGGVAPGLAPGLAPAADAKSDPKSDAPPKPGAAPARPMDNPVAPKLGNPLGTSPLQNPLQSPPPPAEDDF